MPCPHHNGEKEGRTEAEPTDGDDSRDTVGVERRDFMKSALAIGGSAALSTIIGLAGMPDQAAAEAPIGIADRLNRQHAWDEYEFTDPDKGTLPPSRHVLLMLEYQGDGEPDAEHRKEVQHAFRELEATIEWGNGGGDGPANGLLFTIGYSPAYFDRFDEDLPDGIDPHGPFEKPSLITAESLINTPGVTLDHEDPVPESDGDDGPTYDACLHLASEHEQVLMAAEELLWGEIVDIDDDGTAETLDHTLEGIFERPEEYPDRRVGFAGTKNLEEPRRGG